MKSGVFDGSVVNGLRQPILDSFVIVKPPGYRKNSDPETIHHKKINRAVLNTIAFYWEDEDHKEVNFNWETLIFTLQSIKI